MKKKAGRTGRGKKSYKKATAKQPPGYYVAFTFLIIASLGMTVFISGLYLLILGASLEKAGILTNPIFEVYINYTVMRFGETMLMLLKPRVLIIMGAVAIAFRILYPKLARKKKE